MPTNPNLANKLCIKDGVLLMQDGSDVQAYLRSHKLANSDAVNIFPREVAQRLLRDAELYRLSLLNSDERFCLAA